MDDLDRKILSLLAKNARMPVKEIAEQVALTSPAVSSRIHKLETDGIISGYTVVLNRPADRVYVDALTGVELSHHAAHNGDDTAARHLEHGVAVVLVQVDDVLYRAFQPFQLLLHRPASSF